MKNETQTIVSDFAKLVEEKKWAALDRCFRSARHNRCEKLNLSVRMPHKKVHIRDTTVAESDLACLCYNVTEVYQHLCLLLFVTKVFFVCCLRCHSPKQIFKLFQPQQLQFR